MQREVVRILKKWLHEGYEDNQHEYSILSPYQVMAEDWTQLSEPPTEEKIRGCARDLIATIRGIDEADLYIIPDKDRMVRILMDIVPDVVGEQKDWAEIHADFLIEQLQRLHQPTFWRGKKITSKEVT